MKVCPSCGAEEDTPQAVFCKNCGAGLVEAAQTPRQPAAPSPAPPPTQPPAKRGITTTTWILGATVGVLTVVIVVLALFLALRSDGDSEAGGEAERTTVETVEVEYSEEETEAGARRLARELVRSLEEEDIEGLLSCFEEDYLEERKEEASGPMAETVQEMSVEEIMALLFDVADIKIKGLKLECDVRGQDSAAITTVAGEVKISISGDYAQASEVPMEDLDVDLSKNPLTFEMERKDGKWYIVNDPFGDLRGELLE